MKAGNLTFTPDNDENLVCVTVPMIDDNSTETSELFLGLLTTNEDRVALSPAQTNITIIDDDGMLLNQGCRKWCSG